MCFEDLLGKGQQRICWALCGNHWGFNGYNLLCIIGLACLICLAYILFTYVMYVERKMQELLTGRVFQNLLFLHKRVQGKQHVCGRAITLNYISKFDQNNMKFGKLKTMIIEDYRLQSLQSLLWGEESSPHVLSLRLAVVWKQNITQYTFNHWTLFNQHISLQGKCRYGTINGIIYSIDNLLDLL